MYPRKGFLGSILPSVVLVAATLFCGVRVSHCYAVTEDGVTTVKSILVPRKNFMDHLRGMVANAFDTSWSTASRMLVQAEVSPICSAGLLKMARGMRNLEPWAFRMFDASGKYPNGLLQATTSDPGAFDECVETVLHDPMSGRETLRAQYCNLRLRITRDPSLMHELVASFRIGHPRLAKFTDYFTDERLSGVRIGICVLKDCNETELQALVDTVKPAGMNIEINNCVTSIPVPLSSVQIGITVFLTILGAIIAAATILDLYLAHKKRAKNNLGILTCLMVFSAAGNSALITRATKKDSDAYALRFLHGMRLLSMIWIMLGHSYGTISDTLSCLANNISYFERWENMIVTGGYLSVDTFFFLSGFLMCYTITKHRANGWIIFFLAVIRRIIRSTTPLFFMIMCIYMLPAFTSGPDAKTFFDKFYYEMNNHWWDMLLQVRNFRGEITFSVMPHVWYLSADFQLFIVSLLVILTLKNRHRWIIGVFILLSLLGCSLATWQVAGTHMNPFMVAMTETIPMLVDTLDNYYVMPFYHAVAYFSGCITYFIIVNYKERRLSKALQVTAWCLSLACGLCCLFMKIGWYQQRNPTTQSGKLFAAFFDRILWSLCVSWVTFACSTARGGWLDAFLSWDAFAPLSRLSFGVYLVHSPFFLLTFHISRERIYFSHFFIVTLFFSALVWCFSLSYLLFISCEAPVGRIDKLLFSPRSLKADVTGIASTNSSNGTKPTSVIPHKSTDIVCCDFGPPQCAASEKNKVFIIINGDTVCYHL